MSEIPPEAIEDAAQALLSFMHGAVLAVNSDGGAVGKPADAALAALTAALPHIEAAIREQVASEIEAESLSVNWHKTFINGLGLAARIIRGTDQ